jgi:hypothetical protein
LKKYSILCLALAFWIFDPSWAVAGTGPPDISDGAIDEFLASPFQYDYTTIIDDSTLREFIMALDHQLAIIEYRQRREFTAGPELADLRRQYKNDLEARYRELFKDGFIFKKLTEWQEKTTDPINRSFITLFLWRRNEYMADPSSMQQARELSQRIADRLYGFRFRIDQDNYSAGDAARIIFSGGDISLARELNTLVNDSAALLVPDAAKLYFIYKGLGQQRGYRTSLDYNLSRLSYRKPEWLKIADDLKKNTDAEYNYCLESLKEDADRDNLALFEIERRLTEKAILPDSCFSSDKIETALNRLLVDFGLEKISDELKVRVDSSGFPALSVRLCPPYDNLLLKSNQGDFHNYRRLAAEYGRALPWVYADSSLPYLLREYPAGAEEMLTGLFEELALRPEFLKKNFDIPSEDLVRFETYNRWLTIFHLRRVLLYFYFDYYLSEENIGDPSKLYNSFEDSLFGTGGGTDQWIETLIAGGIETFPEKLAHYFTRIKTAEMLTTRFGEDYYSNPAAGRFLIDNFCRPGRSQTIEEYITGHGSNRLSVDDAKNQWNLR